MRTRHRARILATFLGCGLISLTLAAQRNTPVRTVTQDQWREDLGHFARELPKRHKNLFHSLSREDFQRAVADLDAAIPSLQEHQIIVGMIQIAARVGDGHTSVHVLSSFKLYPVSLFWLGVSSE